MILTKHGQRDFTKKKFRSFYQYFQISNIGIEKASPFPWEIDGVKFVSPSPSGKFLAVIRSGEDPTSKVNSRIYLEFSR